MDVISQDLLAVAKYNCSKYWSGVTTTKDHRTTTAPFKNFRVSNPAKFWKRSLVIPYLLFNNFIKTAISNNLPAFSLLALHPFTMLDMTLEDFGKKHIVSLITIIFTIKQNYNISFGETTRT